MPDSALNVNPSVIATLQAARDTYLSVVAQNKNDLILAGMYLARKFKEAFDELYAYEGPTGPYIRAFLQREAEQSVGHWFHMYEWITVDFNKNNELVWAFWQEDTKRISSNMIKSVDITPELLSEDGRTAVVLAWKQKKQAELDEIARETKTAHEKRILGLDTDVNYPGLKAEA